MDPIGRGDEPLGQCFGDQMLNGLHGCLYNTVVLLSPCTHKGFVSWKQSAGNLLSLPLHPVRLPAASRVLCVYFKVAD